jgi:hypothetical protein
VNDRTAPYIRADIPEERDLVRIFMDSHRLFEPQPLRAYVTSATQTAVLHGQIANRASF